MMLRTMERLVSLLQTEEVAAAELQRGSWRGVRGLSAKVIWCKEDNGNVVRIADHQVTYARIKNKTIIPYVSPGEKCAISLEIMGNTGDCSSAMCYVHERSIMKNVQAYSKESFDELVRNGSSKKGYICDPSTGESLWRVGEFERRNLIPVIVLTDDRKKLVKWKHIIQRLYIIFGKLVVNLNPDKWMTKFLFETMFAIISMEYMCLQDVFQRYDNKAELKSDILRQISHVISEIGIVKDMFISFTSLNGSRTAERENLFLFIDCILKSLVEIKQAIDGIDFKTMLSDKIWNVLALTAYFGTNLKSLVVSKPFFSSDNFTGNNTGQYIQSIIKILTE